MVMETGVAAVSYLTGLGGTIREGDSYTLFRLYDKVVCFWISKILFTDWAHGALSVFFEQ